MTAEAKALGRQVRSFDQELLERQCDAIVERGNFLKFSQDERLKEILLGTGNREIVETSPNDRFWGIGYDTESAEGNTENWCGAVDTTPSIDRLTQMIQCIAYIGS